MLVQNLSGNDITSYVHVLEQWISDLENETNYWEIENALTVHFDIKIEIKITSESQP